MPIRRLLRFARNDGIYWIPAFAGMTEQEQNQEDPSAEQGGGSRAAPTGERRKYWIPNQVWDDTEKNRNDTKKT